MLSKGCFEDFRLNAWDECLREVCGSGWMVKKKHATLHIQFVAFQAIFWYPWTSIDAKNVSANKVYLRKDQIKYPYSTIKLSHASKEVYVKIIIFTCAAVLSAQMKSFTDLGHWWGIVIYWPIIDSVDTDVERKLVCFIIPPAQKSCWGVYWFHFVRPSVCPSCILCPLCSTYSSGWIHLIFIHLIKQLQKVCRM